MIVLFAVIIGVYFFFHVDKGEKEVRNMEGATLPVVYMIWEEQNINQLHGYVKEMNPAYMRESFTPMKEDRKISLQIKNYGNRIKGISYQVRSVDGTRLVEDTRVEDFTQGDDVTNVSFQITNMIDENTEYNLIMKVMTDEEKEIAYYTRTQVMKESCCTEQIQFIQNFSKKTLDKEKSQSLASYIEPSETQDNSNLGYVSIYSNLSQLSWGNLKVERVSSPEVTIKELIGGIGCYQLKYKVMAKNDYNTQQYYNIVEFYRVNWSNGEKYLLNFERQMNQIFEASSQSITPTRINLGIDSDLDINYMASDSTDYIAFVKERQLWSFCEETNEVTSIYTFADQERDGVREEYDQHQLRVLNVSDQGDVDFMVFGYMNRGVHEGTCGMTVYHYSREDNKVEDVAYIASDKPYGVLKETIGKLCYINDDNQMYMLMDNALYSIDLTGNEYVKIVSGLTDGSYVMDKNATTIAWQEGNSLYDASAIRILNIKTGKDVTITAKEGERIRIAGFVQEDFIYGLAKADDIYQDKNGNVTFPMYQLKIIDEQQEIMSYPSSGNKNIYVTDVETDGALISLTRMKKSGQTFENYKADQIRNNDETKEDAVNLSTILTDLKETELMLNFAYKMSTSESLKIIKPGEISYEKENLLEIEEESEKDSKYYVYGHGEVKKACNQLSKAIIQADELVGVVVDASGRTIWERTGRNEEKHVEGITLNPVSKISKQVEACIDAVLRKNGISLDVSQIMKDGGTTLSIYNEYLQERGLDLTGCSLTQVLYYVQQGQPILGMLDENRCVLIVGYDLYNAIMINPETGKEYKQGLEETEEQFKKAGNRFVSLLASK